MRLIQIFTLILFSLLIFTQANQLLATSKDSKLRNTSNGFANELPNEWIVEIRSEEGSIRTRLDSIRVETFHKITLKKRKALRNSLRKIERELGLLNDKILKRDHYVFGSQESDHWKNVVQQAKALQTWNGEALIDLQDVLAENKYKF